MLVLLAVIVCLVSAFAEQKVVVKTGSQQVSFENGFVKAVFDTSSGVWMSELYGDFKGLGSYKENLLAAEGLRLERENADGSVTSGVGKGISSNRNVMEERSQGCSVLTFPHVYDDIANPTVEESWKFTLCDGARTVHFESSGTVLSAQASLQMRTVRHALYARSLSTTGFFDQGVVQIMSAEPKYSHFASSDRLHHAYVLGGVGAIDILRPGATGGEQDQVVLLNGVPDAEGAKYTSGFHEILVGNFSHRDYWVAGSSASDAQVHIGQLTVHVYQTCYPLHFQHCFPNRPSRRVARLLGPANGRSRRTTATSPVRSCPRGASATWITVMTWRV